MLRSSLKTFFLCVVFLAGTSQIHATFFCKEGLARFKGIALSIAAGSVSKIAQNAKYARSTLHLKGEGGFSLVVGAVKIGEGAFGVVFPLKIEGSLIAAHRALGLEPGDELVVKFPHHTSLPPVNKITNASIVSEWEAEQSFFTFCEKYGMAPHPSFQRTILYASVEGEPAFLVKKWAKGTSLVKYGGSRMLSPDQHSKLEELYYYVVFLQREHERLMGQKMSIDIKPDNLYWNGEGWRFYEISRTPQDNTFFTDDGFSGYLSILDGYTGN